MTIEGTEPRNMMSQKGRLVSVMAVLGMIIWSQFEDQAHSASSDDCTMVSSVMESCYSALQPGTFFMKAESVCCRSLENLENRIWDHQLTRYAICECFKASDDDKQVLFNENMQEVHVLCGPHVPCLITSYSDCLHYPNEGINGIATMQK